MSKHVWIALGTALALGLAGPAGAADSDADFVKHAASNGMLEAELGAYAASNAMDPAVRQFGAKMAAEHTKANDELARVAALAGVMLPVQMGDEQRGKLAELVATKGAEFDRAYMDAMVEGHEKAVESFRAQADQNETAIDRWAAKTLPTLETHLQDARSIQQRVEQQPAAMK